MEIIIKNSTKLQLKTKFDSLKVDCSKFKLISENALYCLAIEGLIIEIDPESNIKISYYEDKPQHLRNIFIEKIETILRTIEFLKYVPLSELSTASWICLLWTPFKFSNVDFGHTSFLVYHQLNEYVEISEKYNNLLKKYYVEVPVIGILPIKFNESAFLENIVLCNF